jgi:hypothetical protein
MVTRATRWHPRQISSYAIDYDPARMLLADGALIDAAPNYGPMAGADAVQATEIRKPTYVADVLNGHPVMRFNGSRFLRVTFASAIPQPTTVFVVGKTAGLSQYFIDGKAADTTRQAYHITGTGLHNANAGANLSSVANDAEFNVSCVLFNDTASRIGINGLETVGAAGTRTMGGLTIGSNAQNTLYLTGDIARILVYTGALTYAERAQVIRYLGRRYNVTTPMLGLTTPLTQYGMMRQRDENGMASVPIAGAVGAFVARTGIEARLDGGAWADIDAEYAAEGTFGGSLNAPEGQGVLDIRLASTPSLTASSAAKAVAIGDVFVVAGQSNAQGDFDNFQSASHATLTSFMFRETPATSRFWRDLVDPSDSDGRGSVWPLLATLLMADQGVPAGFITTAEGGTGLVPPSADWAVTGNKLEQCIEMVNGSGVNGARAVLWFQGEEDAKTGATTAQYKAAASAMLDEMQSRFGFAVKLIMGQLGPNTVVGTTRANLDGIRTAQSELWDEDADILPGPLTHDLVLTDTVHFRSDAQAAILAGRWFRAISHAFYGGTEGRAPSFVSAAKVDATHIDVVFALDGTTTLDIGASPTLGWIVTDDGGTRAVTAVALQSATTLRLTLDGALSTNPIITFGSGNDSSGCTILDNGTYPLPPVPFLNKAVT